MDKKHISAAVIFIVLELSCLRIYADTLILNNDMRYEGELSEETDSGVWFQIPKTGNVFFRHDEIKAVIAQGVVRERPKRSFFQRIMDKFIDLIKSL